MLEVVEAREAESGKTKGTFLSLMSERMKGLCVNEGASEKVRARVAPELTASHSLPRALLLILNFGRKGIYLLLLLPPAVFFKNPFSVSFSSDVFFLDRLFCVRVCGLFAFFDPLGLLYVRALPLLRQWTAVSFLCTWNWEKDDMRHPQRQRDYCKVEKQILLLIILLENVSLLLYMSKDVP